MDKYYKKNEQVNGYSILKRIGEGRYGIAYLAEDENGEKVVIKQLKKKELEQTRKKLFYEERIMKTLNDPRFPKFISKFKDKYREGYILEYMEGIVLHDLLSKERYRFSKREIYEIADKIIEIIDILQKNNIIHRDIRLPNLIVMENKEIALIDFGLARFIDGDRYEPGIDYWFLGDCLIRLYYSAYYKGEDSEDKPWFEELDLTDDESEFLKTLMGIDNEYDSLEEIKAQLAKVKSSS